MEDGGKDCASDKGANDGVAVRGGEALCVALGARAIFFEVAVCLLDACNDCRNTNGNGINGGSCGETKLLAGAQGGSIPSVGDVEVWNDAEHALLFLERDLLVG